MRNAPQRVDDDPALERPLGLGLDVLPAAAAATQRHELAGRSDPVGGPIHDVDEPGPAKVLALLGDLDAHALAGQRAVDEHHAALIVVGESRPAGDDALGEQLHHDTITRPA